METKRRTIIISGASQGLGQALARKFASLGFDLVLSARSADKLDALCREISEKGMQASAIPADLSDASGIEVFCTSIQELDANIFGFIHAAGVSNSHKAEDFEIESAQRMLTLNLFAFQAIAATLLPSMKAAKQGRLLAIASVAGLKGYPYISSYAASKHALVGATRSIAPEVARHGICVNALCPGYLDTPMTAATIANIAAQTGRSPEEARAELEAISPQKRLFTVEEVSEAAAFLFSDAAAGINGQALPICGGELS